DEVGGHVESPILDLAEIDDAGDTLGLDASELAQLSRGSLDSDRGREHCRINQLHGYLRAGLLVVRPEDFAGGPPAQGWSQGKTAIKGPLRRRWGSRRRRGHRGSCYNGHQSGCVHRAEVRVVRELLSTGGTGLHGVTAWYRSRKTIARAPQFRSRWLESSTE